MKKYYIVSFAFLFTSCTGISEHISTLSPITITILFALLFVSMLAMFFYVAKKKKQADRTAVQFSHNVRNMLNKIEGSDNKIKALEHTIVRINEDKQYKKDTVWRDKLLSKVYQELAAIYYTTGDESKVLHMCSTIIALEPNHMMSYYNRGTLYGNLGMYDKAILDLSEAITLDATYANAYNNRGMIYQKMGELDKAIIDYGYSIEIEKTPISYYNRGNAQAINKNKDEALHNYKTALQMLENNNNQPLLKQIEEGIAYLKD